MFKVIAILFAGIGAGYLLRHVEILQKVSKPISWTIFLLLFLLGVSVGSNEEVLSNLASLGGTAALISIAGTLGSLIMASLVWHFFFKGKDKREKEEVEDER